MSHEGKMRRGKFYNGQPNLAANLQEDVEYFLEQTKPAPVKEVKKVKKEKKDGSN